MHDIRPPRKPGASTAPAANVHKNEVHIAGELVRDPELKYTPSGKVVAHCTVATRYQNSTEYHRITAWEQLAQKVGELAKQGDYVKVVGRLSTRSWDDQKTQTKRYMTETIAWQFVIPNKEATSTTEGTVSDESIPF